MEVFRTQLPDGILFFCFFVLFGVLSAALSNMENILRLEKVNFEYLKGKPALVDISFEVYPGEILAIVGSNGGGKSTLLHLMNG